MSIIDVEYKVYRTSWFIEQVFAIVKSKRIVSFDIETRGIYTKEERKVAKKELADCKRTYGKKYKQLLQIANNSGLSHPSLIKTTHFIFGLSERESIIIIVDSMKDELRVWNRLAQLDTTLLIHNASFDLKVMHHRIGKFPSNYEDTSLMAKTLLNHVNVWKAKVGLKDLMQSYYKPSWSVMDDYEPDKLDDPDFLEYASIDGAATYKLYFDIVESI